MSKIINSERVDSSEDVNYVAIISFQFGVYFPYSADLVQDRQPYPVDSQFAESDDHTRTPFATC